MARPKRISRNFTLTEEAIEKLEMLAAHHDKYKSDVLIMLIKNEASACLGSAKDGG